MTIATLAYDVPKGWAPTATIIAQASAVPIPLDVMQALSVFVSTDATTDSPPVVRRAITLTLTPSVTANTVAVLVPGDKTTGSPIRSITMLGSGLDYVSPPVVTAQGGNPLPESQAKLDATLLLGGVAVLTGGSGYTGATFASVIGGMRPPVSPVYNELGTTTSSKFYKSHCCVQGLTLVTGGRNYSTNAIVQFEGGLDTGGTHATALLTRNSFNGVVTGLTLTRPGSGYISRPNVFIYDPGTNKGSGAIVTPRMGVGDPATVSVTIVMGAITALGVIQGGSGYIQVPQIIAFDTGGGTGATFRPRMGVGNIAVVKGGNGFTTATVGITVTPAFTAMFPSGKAAPFETLMQSAIARAVTSPVNSVPVVIT